MWILFLELLWIIFYSIASIWTYALGSIADAVRTDVTSLDKHALTLLTVLSIMYTRRTPWHIIILLLSLVRDVLNLVEISVYSKLDVINYALWCFTLFTACYQTALTIVAIGWFTWLLFVGSTRGGQLGGQRL